MVIILALLLTNTKDSHGVQVKIIYHKTKIIHKSKLLPLQNETQR